MTSSHLIDAEQLLADQLAQASPDLLRGLLSTFIAALMGLKPTPCAGRATANAAMSGPISATATATVISTPVPQPSTSRSPSCARAAISRTGCCSAASELNAH
ncbi:transposase [Mycobacterium tuberculosis]|nr:transposase [Mycobacterium tuberculosis]